MRKFTSSHSGRQVSCGDPKAFVGQGIWSNPRDDGEVEICKVAVFFLVTF